MSSQVLVIAELGSTWRFGNDERENVRRGIRAAKDCDANILKMQWCSDGRALAKRRGESEAAGEMYAKYLEWPREWMQEFKEFADEVGIEWACTAFLPQDVAVIAPLVKRFKVAAKEAGDKELQKEINGHLKPVIISFNGAVGFNMGWGLPRTVLHCVSKYPTPVDEIHLRNICNEDTLWRDGLSDHTGHVLTGAVAVGAGARIIEAHIRLSMTPTDNPDYPHSHEVDYIGISDEPQDDCFADYVANIRLAERMCG